MIDIGSLQSFDAIQWLGTGGEVSSRYAVDQSTVSRNCTKVKNLFGVDFDKDDGEWIVDGDQTFLSLERQVHQLARFKGAAPLRLEATYWSAPTLCSDLPRNWILGRSNIVGVKRNCQLLRDCIVDAWIAGLPDAPCDSDPELITLQLSKMPIYFACSPDHPLLGKEAISLDDISEFPTLALPNSSYPIFESVLHDIGLGNTPARMRRYNRETWEGRVEEDLVIGYGTPLSLAVAGGNLRKLPIELPIDSGDALVIRREHLRKEAILNLLANLRGRLLSLSEEIQDIEMLDDAVTKQELQFGKH